jgi:WD40 repeat protein
MLKHPSAILLAVSLIITATGCSIATPALTEMPINTSVILTPQAGISDTSTPAIPSSSTLTATFPQPTPSQVATQTPSSIPQQLDPISAATANQLELLAALTGHTAGVVSLAFSPGGQYLASAGSDNTIKIWDLHTGRELISLPSRGIDLNALAFSPSANMLASSALIWDVDRGQVFQTIGQGDLGPGKVAFSPDASLLAVATHYGPFFLWDVSTGQILRMLDDKPGAFSFSVEFSPDGTLLATSERSVVRLWEVASGQVITTLKHQEDRDVHDVAFSPDGRFLAAGGTENDITIWDLSTGQKVQSFRQGTGMYGLAYSPDGSLLASAVADRTVKLWEVATGRLLYSLRHQDDVLAVAFSPDGSLLASGGYDNLVSLWGVTR